MSQPSELTGRGSVSHHSDKRIDVNSIPNTGVIVTEDTECPMKRHTSSDDQEIKKKKMEQIDSVPASAISSPSDLPSMVDLLQKVANLEEQNRELARRNEELESMVGKWKDDLDAECTAHKELQAGLCSECYMFPHFLSLPNETITRVFSFLPLEDRLYARVSKRLHGIEGNSRYVKTIRIVSPRSSDHDDAFEMEDTVCELNVIRSIARNASIGDLSICLNDLDDLQILDEALNIVKETKKIHYLELDLSSCPEFFTDDILLDCNKKCKDLEVEGMNYVTPEALYQVFKSMIDGSSSLHECSGDGLSEGVQISCLNRFGITYRDGEFFSNGNIQAYTGEAQLIFFANNFEFCFNEEFFYIKKHKTEKSLNKAMKREGQIPVSLSVE